MKMQILLIDGSSEEISLRSHLIAQNLGLSLLSETNNADLLVLIAHRIDLDRLLKEIGQIQSKVPLLLASEFLRPDFFTATRIRGLIPLSELEDSILALHHCLPENLDHLPHILPLNSTHPQRIIPRRYSLAESLKGSFSKAGQVSILPAMGCQKRCHFCSILSREGFRKTGTLIELLNEIERHYKQGTRHFWIKDQAFNDDPQKLRAFCEGILQKGWQLKWKTGFLPEVLSPNLLNLLVESGLESIEIPFFSASDRVLHANNIAWKRKQLREFLDQMHLVKIKIELNVFAGMPFETWADTFKTLDFLTENQHLFQIRKIQTLRIEPGSFLERRQEEYGLTLNQRDPAAWIREERDHLNDLSTRKTKALFLEQILNGRLADPELLQKYKDWQNSKVDISLVTVPPWGYLNPPVGIAKLASWLKSKNRSCSVFDFNVGFYLLYPDFQRLWHVENKSYWSNDLSFDIIRHIYDRDIDLAIEKILDVNCSLIGFSAVDPKERMTVEFIQRLRERESEIKIILGGQVCGTTEYRHIFYEKLGASGIDCYVVGEGEDTLIEILERLEHKKDLKGIAGTAEVNEKGEWIFGACRPKVDIWNAPITTYEEFDLQEYSCRELLVEWSRGCIGTCSFCKAKILDGKFRSYSPENVVNSLKFYTEQYGIDLFTICDLAVNGNYKLLDKVCDAIIASGLKVRLRAQGIPRRQMKLELLRKMKAAGFIEMQWGVESGSDLVLKGMDKDWMFTVAEAQQVIRDCSTAEIKTCMFCMVGYPTETESDHRMTFDFIDRNAEYLDMVKSVNSLHIITDTPVHHQAIALGVNLPEMDYHYLWSFNDNTHEVRQRRVKEILDLIRIKNLECLETNYLEGRQHELNKGYKEEYVPMEERVARLRKDINQLIDYRINQQENFEEENNPQADFLANNRDLLGVFHGKKAFLGPRTVEIDLSNNCNFNCIGCWCHCDYLEELKTPAQKRKNHLPLETIKGLILDLAQMGTRTIQLAGPGEPFTHPQIMEIIRYIKGNGLELRIITNFSYITHAIAQELIDLKVDHLTCSLWSGSEEAFLKTHPNQKGSMFHQIKEILAFFGNQKKYNLFPHIKIYNVINHANASDVENMVNLGREVKADTMEFTVVDTVSGKTDFLSLTPDDVEVIQAQFDRITASATYPDPPGRKHLSGLSREQMEEHYEVNAKFFTDLDIYQGFQYEPVNKIMTCKAGISNEKMVHDTSIESANKFYFNPHACMSCKHLNTCSIDKKDFSIKTRFFAVLGFGSFMRRARLSVQTRQDLEGNPKSNPPSTPFVDTLPCTIGWSYSRITTSGDVIPCCKGYNKPLGNLYANTFQFIWQDFKMQEFRFKAKNLSKGDAYFEPIGCYKACDNVGHNLEIHRRIQNLKPREKQWLLEEAKRQDQL